MVWLPNKWSIKRGDDVQIGVHMLDEQRSVINVSGASAIKLLITNKDGSILIKDAISGFAVSYSLGFWVYSFQLSQAETRALPLGLLSVEVEILFGSLIQRYTMADSLTTTDPLI